MLQNIAIIGMGALGVLFGNRIQKNLPEGGSLHFIADAERMERYRNLPTSCNGELCNFSFADAAQEGKPADCILFATKATGLEAAIASAKNYVGEHTILVSVLNGISSEELLAEHFGGHRVVKCVARGMDATKLGDNLVYHSFGELVIGAAEYEREKQPLVDALDEFFTAVDIPHQVTEEIDRVLWSKFMMNVGLNQSMMVYETNYGGMQTPGKPRETMIAAMREVMALSEYEKVCLTEQDFTGALALLDSLNPEGYTSMRQDAINHRPSEVESFAGTVLRLAEKHGMDAPANRFLYDSVRKMEAAYQ